MPRRVPLLLLVALSLVGCRRAAHRAPDVILVTVDAVRADRFEAAATPNLDRVADSGVRFTSAVTPLPRTTPALASLLTGLWPHHHGSREVGQPVLHGTSLAAILGEHGYRTVGVCSNPLSGRPQHMERGFDVFVERGELPSDRADVVTDAALKAVREADSGGPLFLWVHYMDPHFFYEPPAPFAPGHDADGCRALIARLKARRVASGHVYADLDGMASRVLGGCRALYDGEISYADHEVGRLFEGLRAAGHPIDHAIVVFTSDHGENQGEGQLFYEHGPNVNDAVLRVPLVMAGPGLPRHEVDGGLVRLEDVTPTILALVGVDPAKRPAMDGMDLLPQIRGKGPGPALAYAESASALHPTYFPALSSGWAASRHCLNGTRYSLCRTGTGPASLYDHVLDPDLQKDVSAEHPDVRRALEAAAARWPAEEAREHTVRDGRFKLVARPRLEGGYAYALYDLAADPKETEDVSAAHPEDEKRLRTAMDAWAKGLPHFEAPERSDDDLEDLRDLGYVQ